MPWLPDRSTIPSVTCPACPPDMPAQRLPTDDPIHIVRATATALPPREPSDLAARPLTRHCRLPDPLPCPATPPPGRHAPSARNTTGRQIPPDPAPPTIRSAPPSSSDIPQPRDLVRHTATLQRNSTANDSPMRDPATADFPARRAVSTACPPPADCPTQAPFASDAHDKPIRYWPNDESAPCHPTCRSWIAPLLTHPGRTTCRAYHPPVDNAAHPSAHHRPRQPAPGPEPTPSARLVNPGCPPSRHDDPYAFAIHRQRQAEPTIAAPAWARLPDKPVPVYRQPHPPPTGPTLPTAHACTCGTPSDLPARTRRSIPPDSPASLRTHPPPPDGPHLAPTRRIDLPNLAIRHCISDLRASCD